MIGGMSQKAKRLAESLDAGNVQMASGLPGDAIPEYRRATDIDPNSAAAWESLGKACKANGRSGDAAEAFSRLVQLTPRSSPAHHNYGAALGECADIEAAINEFHTALSLDPSNAKVASTLLYTLWFADDLTEDRIIGEHRAWAEKFAEPLKATRKPHANSRDPNRRLKIGYVSPDLRIHPVGRFMLPVFVEHDRNQFAIHVYSAAPGMPDALGEKIKQRSDSWREIENLSDDAAAQLIRSDGIDILIDLSLHMGRQMGIFARKPAPVQITYLGYVGTTGLDAVDWRIIDPILEPTPARFVEKPLTIPHYWCYKPSIYNVEPGPAPHERNGYVTFGSLNSFKKAGPTARRLWADVLRAVPTSRMIVHASEGSHREKFLSDMAIHGIERGRFSFVGLTPMGTYMQAYQSIDIALDTFPYTGGTTTCDALWMGVPTVTLAGTLGISRMGASILTSMGLHELVAQDAADFSRIAIELAADPQRISQQRAAMRDRLYKSPLVDAKRFTRGLEAAYRRAWQALCKQSTIPD